MARLSGRCGVEIICVSRPASISTGRSFFSGREFVKLKRKRLFEEFVVARFIDRLEEPGGSFAAENLSKASGDD
jgi:hypothetical protein